MKISLTDINYKGHHFKKVDFETDDDLTEFEINEKIKKFLDDVIVKMEKKK